jgi:hypothetical protein
MIVDSLAQARRWKRELERLQAEADAGAESVKRWLAFAPLIVLALPWPCCSPAMP